MMTYQFVPAHDLTGLPPTISEECPEYAAILFGPEDDPDFAPDDPSDISIPETRRRLPGSFRPLPRN